MIKLLLRGQKARNPPSTNCPCHVNFWALECICSLNCLVNHLMVSTGFPPSLARNLIIMRWATDPVTSYSDIVTIDEDMNEYCRLIADIHTQHYSTLEVVLYFFTHYAVAAVNFICNAPFLTNDMIRSCPWINTYVTSSTTNSHIMNSTVR